MSHNNNCLNCNTSLVDAFCPHCGQKADTHQITFKHFIFHDILHGVWHFEKGILFTLKEALFRPSQAALDYISGKRIRYYNVFYLSLLVIGLNILLIHFYNEFKVENNITVGRNNTPNVTKFFADNVKIILFSIVPLLALNAYMLFKRLRLNLAEHFILAGICLLGILIVALFFNLTNFLNEREFGNFFGILELLFFFILLFYPLWPYYNAIKNHYTFLGALWRVLVFQLIIFIEVSILIAVIIIYLTNGKGDFYISL
ncbi:DUF3667 domain-containing protein [Flavobacterium phycosphaerae]|uniref:DUF3667 domain-containing protein n=1 Tax=Flavobacterium phycosphaerae TaxID=2697515 RepID=UPI0013895811|nr:DUF3667 domain-containing protein [Flavobacterium phycosphaerae]